MIKKAFGYVTDDGKMFANLDDAAGHTYGQQIKKTFGERGNGVFGVATILKHSREVERILAAYNAELDRIEREFSPQQD